MSTSKVKLKTIKDVTDAAYIQVNELNEIITPAMDACDYKDVLDYFIDHNGFLTKCIDENGTLEGYLVRAECPCNRDYVFINYRPVNMVNYNSNHFFEKSIAIMQTFKKGLRFYKKNVIVEDISFDEYIIDLDKTMIGTNKFNIGSVTDTIILFIHAVNDMKSKIN